MDGIMYKINLYFYDVERLKMAKLRIANENGWYLVYKFRDIYSLNNYICIHFNKYKFIILNTFIDNLCYQWLLISYYSDSF